MKSCNRTQISLRNDPINRRMQGFSFRVDEDKNWSSRCDFFLLSRSKFDFKHSIEAEMSEEHYETNGTRIEALHIENLMKNRKHVLRREERYLKKTKVIFGRPMKRLSRWTVAIVRPLRWIDVLILIVGFKSGGFDLIGDPSLRMMWTVIISDWTALIISLKWVFDHVRALVIWWTLCPRNLRRPMIANIIRRSTLCHVSWNQRKQGILVPHGEKWGKKTRI